MKFSVKAPLFSALLFPGLGYFCIHQPKRGIIAIAMVCAGLLTIIREIYNKAVIIAEEITNGNIPLDIATIHQKSHEIIATLPMTTIITLSIIIGAIWAFSIIDCYLLGKKLEQSLSASNT